MRLAEHIAALLLHHSRGDKDGHQKAIFRDVFVDELSRVYDIECPNGLIDDALEILNEFQSIEVLRSPLTGDLLEVRFDPAHYYFSNSSSADVEDWGYEARCKELREKYPVIRTYFQGGQQWVDRVTAVLADLDIASIFYGSDGQSINLTVPASDRIVKLTDNQISEIDDLANDLSQNLSMTNAIDGDKDLKDRFLGQIAASRELIRAGSVRAYLVYETLARMLLSLIDKYKDHVIGEVSRKLLDLIIQHILGK